jgi:flavin-binding protein dodecin
MHSSRKRKEQTMGESVYKVIELIGTSATSWEEAAKNAVERAASTLEDIRVAEVDELDMRVEENKVVAYRAKVKVSFKYRAE